MTALSIIKTYAIIAASAANVLRLPLTEFGYSTSGPDGALKYQGILVRLTPRDPTETVLEFRTGTFIDPNASSQTLERKFGLIRENMGIRASIEKRNPAAGFWGGGILSQSNDWLCGCTGQPELVDHLWIAAAMRRGNALTREKYEHLTNASFLRSVLEERGMRIPQFNTLKRGIEKAANSAYLGLFN